MPWFFIDENDIYKQKNITSFAIIISALINVKTPLCKPIPGLPNTSPSTDHDKLKALLLLQMK